MVSSISIKGGSSTSPRSFFCFLLWMDNRIAGNKMRLVNMDINKVNDTRTPKATVPPKLEAEKMEKPQNKIMEVYTMLNPVSLKVAEMAPDGVRLFFMSSCLYLVKK